MFDIEAAFLNAELDQPVFIEWPQGMEELGFINEKDKVDSCIQRLSIEVDEDIHKVSNNKAK